MPVSYVILPKLDVTYVRYFGHVSPAHISFAFDTHLSDSDFRPGRREFADLSELHKLAMDYEATAQLFERMTAKYQTNGRSTFTALYAPRPELAELAFAFTKLTEGSEFLTTKVFENASDALQALCIDLSPQQFFDSVEEACG